MKTVLAITVVAGLTSLTSGARAGDAAAGATKSLACQACHLTTNPASTVPHLVGQREGYLAAQLTAFKSGERKHELMNAIAGQLSEADIDDLAAYWSGEPAGSDTSVPAAATQIRQSRMPFPKDFPKGFTVYRTENDPAQHGITKSYVNAVARTAAKAGKPLPEGSVIMVVNYAAKLDAAQQPVLQKDGSWAIDKAVSYSGMETRAGWGAAVPELLRNANWSYNVFSAARAPVPEFNQTACLACHKPAAATSYVFTLERIKAN